MNRLLLRLVAAGLPVVAACGASGAARPPARVAVEPTVVRPPGPTPAEKARADSGRPPYTAADVRFMSGMIGHHAQAVLMAGWAPTHGASRSLQILAERIAVSQEDEIALMQTWLRDRREAVPSADAAAHLAPGAHAGGHTQHGPPGPPGATHMPGMLTAEQLAQLDAARGRQFDRLFLTFMIQHHRGALSMVEALFGAPGAGQDDTIFKFASDVQADQTTEIERMTEMLAALPPDAPARP